MSHSTSVVTAWPMIRLPPCGRPTASCSVLRPTRGLRRDRYSRNWGFAAHAGANVSTATHPPIRAARSMAHLSRSHDPSTDRSSGSPSPPPRRLGRHWLRSGDVRRLVVRSYGSRAHRGGWRRRRSPSFAAAERAVRMIAGRVDRRVLAAAQACLGDTRLLGLQRRNNHPDARDRHHHQHEPPHDLRTRP